VESGRSRAKGLGGISACIAALIAALALTIAPAGAQAATPVLEFVPSAGASFPIFFEAEGTREVSARLNDFKPILHCTESEGEGDILGPRTAVGDYFFTGCTAREGLEPPVKCKSAGAEEEEIVAEDVDAELVFIDQTKHEVGMLLDPAGGIYMKFSCGGEPVEAKGPFVSPVGEINKAATVFSAILKRNGTEQFPHEYESFNGEKILAEPTGKRESSVKWEESAVELAFEVFTDSPLEIKAINSAEVQAKEEEAAAKKRQEDDAAKAAADKKHQEEEAAKAAAAKKAQEDAAKAKQADELRQKQLAQAKKRAQKRTKALKQCRKLKTTQKRTRCEARVKKRFSAPKAHSMRAARF
jgi:hypothetical protein